ncbi:MULTISPECIES: MGMT family protein [Leucobacter]|uniref:Methylated-DNA-[protein]-cysteine S-methyltransferase DNA binding domain-containing protein n=2 Tax=Leucobacter TaxID=55968 RepID=A0ABP5MZH1_9MICO|nr:MGMT family protein [Leucobacter manosquensis]MBS3183294.1 MGMT family protein [Leucobacter manosquensis]
MPSAEFVEAVLDVVARIPPGRVMTYGDVGIAVGSEAPRAVGRVMALYGHGSPWWRVVPASGNPPQGHAVLALPHYVDEGTPIRVTGAPRAGTAAAAASAEVAHRAARSGEYRIALSAARLPYTHEIYGEVAL